MQLIVGLGNPGVEYINTRHNAGFLVVDKLQKMKLPKNVVVRKSKKFMNDSGSCINVLLHEYKVDLPNLYVAHDDLDIPLGSYKIQFGVGPKDHNGINSVEEELGTKDFWRIRVGVENRKVSQVAQVSRVPRGEEYVLQDFTNEEKVLLNKTIGKLLIDLIALISK